MACASRKVKPRLNCSRYVEIGIRAVVTATEKCKANASRSSSGGRGRSSWQHPCSAFRVVHTTIDDRRLRPRALPRCGACALVGSLLAGAAACVPPSPRRTGPDPSPRQLAELWVEPAAPRNLIDGPLFDGVKPSADARYEILDRDTRGFSITYRVRDEHGRTWNVKIGPESQTEVVTSRIVWALGYHEVPSYFVERWIGVEKDGGRTAGHQFGGARFRPHDLPMKAVGTWSWQRNPFVGTRPYNGLVVLMMLLNSTDIKNENNTLYELEGRSQEQASRWYVVKDLGASLGETGRFDPRRGNVDAFEREPFVLDVSDGHPVFGYRGRHQELLDGITVDDVRWMCERVRRISNRQWHDAFRAGNFAPPVIERYIARINQKADEGLDLRWTGSAPAH
jgi:hypothetical protein